MKTIEAEAIINRKYFAVIFVKNTFRLYARQPIVVTYNRKQQKRLDYITPH